MGLKAGFEEVQTVHKEEVNKKGNYQQENMSV